MVWYFGEDPFMKCPDCEKTGNKVIDSRSSKDGIAIIRRRQCLSCSSRFSTYESTPEQLVPFRTRKIVEGGSPAANLEAMLSFVTNTAKILSQGSKDLIKKVEKREKALAAKEAAKKARERKVAKRKAVVSEETETIFKIIKRHKKGIDISKLRDTSDFDAKKLERIVFKLRKRRKIKSLRRGFYVAE
jgi:transcriptional repressor NrdR